MLNDVIGYRESAPIYYHRIKNRKDGTIRLREGPELAIGQKEQNVKQ